MAGMGGRRRFDGEEKPGIVRRGRRKNSGTKEGWRHGNPEAVAWGWRHTEVVQDQSKGRRWSRRQGTTAAHGGAAAVAAAEAAVGLLL